MFVRDRCLHLLARPQDKIEQQGRIPFEDDAGSPSANQDREGRRFRPRNHRPRVGRGEGTEHAAAEMVAVCLLRHHRLGARCCSCCIRRCPCSTGYFHGMLGYSQRDAVDADVAELAAQRKLLMDQIADAVVRRYPKRSRAASQVALTGGRIASPRTASPAMARAAAAGRAIRRWRPALDLGRHAGGHPADHHPWHPQRRPRRARERRCRASAPMAY